MLSPKPKAEEAAVPRRSTTTTDDILAAEAEVIRLGKDALERVKQTFDNWLEVARALGVGRRNAMNEAGTDDTEDRGYRKAFGRWLARHPEFDDLNRGGMLAKTTRYWLLRCYDHEAEIVAWRKDKPLELVRYHFPQQVFTRWARVNRPELLMPGDRDDAPKPAAQRRRDSQAAAIDDVVTKLTHVSDDISRQMAGTQLTLDLSSPEMISESAQVVFDIYGAAYGNDALGIFCCRLIALVDGAKKRPAREPSARRIARGVAINRQAEEA